MGKLIYIIFKGVCYMTTREDILKAMKEAGKPVSAGEVEKRKCYSFPSSL